MVVVNYVHSAKVAVWTLFANPSIVVRSLLFLNAAGPNFILGDISNSSEDGSLELVVIISFLNLLPKKQSVGILVICVLHKVKVFKAVVVQE